MHHTLITNSDFDAFADLYEALTIVTREENPGALFIVGEHAEFGRIFAIQHLTGVSVLSERPIATKH